MIVMERGEPALVPEWLKGSNGGITGSGSSLHHLASSFQSDDLHSPLSVRSRASGVCSDHDTPRSSSFYRISGSHFRRSSSSNGSFMRENFHSRASGSFGRSHRDKDWERDLDKDWLLLGVHRPFSDSLTPLPSRMDKDTLRHSRSMASGKQGDFSLRKSGNEANNGIHVGGCSATILNHIHQSTFERDFPSLGAEEKPAGLEVAGVASPGLSTVSQSLSMSSSTVIGGEGWSSALAEVPILVAGNNSVLSPVAHTTPFNTAAVPPAASTGLNMAETLAQAPVRARTAPQLSAETQRLEELAIKQSRQLIPMTPTMPKTLATPSDKTKVKASRTIDMSSGVKTGQQLLSPQALNHSLCGSTRSDSLKLTQSASGKLLLLKGREKNGVIPAIAIKEVPGPTKASRVQVGLVQPATLAPSLRSPSANPKTPGSSVFDRRSQSQAQDRNDFFNSLRKKVSSMNHNSAASYSSCLASSNLSDSSQRSSFPEEMNAAAVTSDSTSHCSQAQIGRLDGAQNGDNCKASEAFTGEGKIFGSDAVCPDEEEAAFLRSLGWEENAGDEEALTEEEIKAFYEEYMKLKPSAKLCKRLRDLNNLPME